MTNNQYQPAGEKEPIGKIITGRMLENSVNSLPGISEEITIQLKHDNFWPNSIPILIFRNVLRLLAIDITEAVSAIYVTVDILLAKKDRENEGKLRLDTRSDLWECKEAVDKYVTRLNELFPSTPNQSDELQEARKEIGMLKRDYDRVQSDFNKLYELALSRLTKEEIKNAVNFIKTNL